MRNLSIGIKLILVAAVVLLLPITAIGLISIREASSGMRGLEEEQLEKRTKEISKAIYNILYTEKKLAIEFAGREETLTALDNSENVSDEEKYENLQKSLKKAMDTAILGEDYEDIIIVDKTGLVYASSNPGARGLDVSEREYIRKALSGQVNIGDPLISKTSGDPVFAIAAPVFNQDGKVTGASALIIKLDFIWEMIKDSTIAETGYTFVADANGLLIAHPNQDVVFKQSMEELSGMEKITERFERGESGYESYLYEGVSKTAGFSSVPEAGWGVFLTVTDGEFMAPVIKVRNAILIMAVAGFMVAFLIFFFFARSITVPIKKGVQFATEISEGKLYTAIDISQKDEIGILADALSNMKDKLREVVSNVYNTSVQVTEGSEQLAQSSEQLSQGATEQAANAEEVSSSVEQMGANIQQNTDNAAQTEKISSQAAIDAEQGGNAVLEAVQAMNEIAEKIHIVGEIARQTNLLSLNAAIEAARAGEHGKGFAVVANEVGKLAAVSQNAAAEILQLATQSVEKANDAGERIRAIVPDIRKTADLVSEISASSNEQNVGAGQITEAMIQLDQVIQQNAASAEEASSMSEELTGQAMQLREMISFFKLDVSGTNARVSHSVRRTGPGTPHSEQKRLRSGIVPAPENRKKEKESFNDQLDTEFIEF